MQSTHAQEAATTALQPRIAQLKEVILTGNYQSAELAGIQLVLIGTKQAADALMDMIKTHKDGEVSAMLAEIIVLSPFRDEYRAELEDEIGAEEIAEAYDDVADLDPRVLKNPTWVIVAEALEKERGGPTGGITHFRH